MRIFDNALLYNPVSCTWIPSSFSVEKGKIKAVGKPGSLSGHLVFDLEGARVIHGLIDSHVHIESSLLTPAEFGRLVLQHGVTTVIADPHEIANVAGTAGIDFMISDAENSPADIFFMVPSCVPATPADVGGAVVAAHERLTRIHLHGKAGVVEALIRENDLRICCGNRDGQCRQKHQAQAKAQ